MCRLFAYGPGDATAIAKPHRLLSHLNQDWFYVSGSGLPPILVMLGYCYIQAPEIKLWDLFLSP